MNTDDWSNRELRFYFREPIQEIREAARLLDEAVSAHLRGDRTAAAQRIVQANIPAISCWCESIWGKNSPHIQFVGLANAPAILAKELRKKPRMPVQAVKNTLIERDGYHCRFCGIPVIRSEVRKRISGAYPELDIWGVGNINQHAAFQTMWAQFDHILPYTRGGTNEIDNLVITCAPCNFGRMQYTLEEVGLSDPRMRAPFRSTWDGLERFR
jgi:hypothetical protein